MGIPSGLLGIEPTTVRTLPFATHVGCGPDTVDGHRVQAYSQRQEGNPKRAITSISIGRTGPTGEIDLPTYHDVSASFM